MAENENKKLYGRAELKEYFKNGKIPNETHFRCLIDSAIIQHDDGISKDEENGYIIAPLGTSPKLITFFKNMDRIEPFFFVEKDMLAPSSIKFRSGIAVKDSENQEENSFYFHQNGSLGIGKKSDPNIKTDVNGFIASQGRIGTYCSGTIPADGKWHDIITELDNCNAFEIVARTGVKRSGKFSLLHATALSTFGKSHSKIRKTCAYYGSFWSVWNKLNIRWKGETHNYNLQLRSNSNFGTGVNIYYNVVKLWDDELFLPETYFYPTEKSSNNNYPKKTSAK